MHLFSPRHSPNNGSALLMAYRKRFINNNEKIHTTLIMANIKNMEMASAISAYQHVTIKKSLFGLSQTLVYQPTQSRIDNNVYEYTVATGEKLARLLNGPEEELQQAINAGLKMQPVQISNYRLEVCRSRDGQFIALQLFRFADFSYTPATGAHFYEGKDAELVNRIF
jgi:hypothetical protein